MPSQSPTPSKDFATWAFVSKLSSSNASKPMRWQHYEKQSQQRETGVILLLPMTLCFLATMYHRQTWETCRDRAYGWQTFPGRQCSSKVPELFFTSLHPARRCYKSDILDTSFEICFISDMTAKLMFKASFIPDILDGPWQWERKKRAPGHNRKPISYQAVSVWIFFLAVIKIFPLTCQRHMITMWGWPGQNFPPLLAPEAAFIFSNNGFLTVVYSNYRTISPTGNICGKQGNGLANIVTMGCTSERALYCIRHDYLEV